MQLPPLAAHLRAVCWPLHRALDRHPLLTPLIAAHLTLSEYAYALAALYAPQALWEERVHDLGPADLAPRLPHLAADLSDLGVTPWPLQAEVPPLVGRDERLGALYVLEGAHLGGSAIAARLAQTLPRGVPCRFFAHAGGLPRWHRFWEFVATIADLDEKAAAWGAQVVMKSYLDHLNGCWQAITSAHPS